MFFLKYRYGYQDKSRLDTGSKKDDVNRVIQQGRSLADFPIAFQDRQIEGITLQFPQFDMQGARLSAGGLDRVCT